VPKNGTDAAENRAQQQTIIKKNHGY